MKIFGNIKNIYTNQTTEKLNFTLINEIKIPKIKQNQCEKILSIFLEKGKDNLKCAGNQIKSHSTLAFESNHDKKSNYSSLDTSELAEKSDYNIFNQNIYNESYVKCESLNIKNKKMSGLERIKPKMNQNSIESTFRNFINCDKHIFDKRCKKNIFKENYKNTLEIHSESFAISPVKSKCILILLIPIFHILV